MLVDLIERCLGFLFILFGLFSPEILKLQTKGTVIPILITALSLVAATYLDIEYAIKNFPYRAIPICFLLFLALVIFIFHRLKSKAKESKSLLDKVKSGFLEAMNTVNSVTEKECIDFIEEKLLSTLRVNMGVVAISAYLFSHIPLKIETTAFAWIFLLCMTVGSMIIMRRYLKRYPFLVWPGAVLFPWIVCFGELFIAGKTGTIPDFVLVMAARPPYWPLDPSGWLLEAVLVSLIGDFIFVSWLLVVSLFSVFLSRTVKVCLSSARFALKPFHRNP